MKCNIILYSYFLSILYIIYVISYNNIILDGSFKCVDNDAYKTCKFNNIYYFNSKWFIFSNKKNKQFNYCINAYAKRLGICWKVYTYNIKDIYKNVKVGKIYKSISSPFQLTYTRNYGHALWDDLYSLYTSLVKLGYKNEKFNLILNKNYGKTHYLIDIMKVLEKFSKGNIIYLNKYKNITILFKTLIVGSSHQCQRCVTLDYTLKYSREYNITKLIRNRMYEVFRIYPQITNPIEGIIIHNKRYSRYEINILKNIEQYYRNDKFIRLKYIDYRNITNFYEQLKLMSKTHIYISGPGTGLLNFPFIADPGIIIHLGHIHFGCPQYLEQYMLEGSPHFKAFYYSPQMRMNPLNYTYMLSLINLAKESVLNYDIFNSKKEENLNDIGKLYVRICKEHKNICNKLIDKYDWGYGKCRGIWAENVVFFPSLYTKIPELKEIVKLYSNITYNLGCKIGINESKQKQCKR